MVFVMPTILGSTLGSAVSSAKPLLWAFFGVVLVVYILVSLSLVYHWQRYSLLSKRISAAQITYFVFSLAAIALAAFSLTFA